MKSAKISTLATDAKVIDSVGAIIENLKAMLPIVRAMVSTIEAIHEADDNDKELITMYIEQLEELDRRSAWTSTSPVKELIRIGRGDYAKIQAKCVNLGLV